MRPKPALTVVTPELTCPHTYPVPLQVARAFANFLALANTAETTNRVRPSGWGVHGGNASFNVHYPLCLSLFLLIDALQVRRLRGELAASSKVLPLPSREDSCLGNIERLLRDGVRFSIVLSITGIDRVNADILMFGSHTRTNRSPPTPSSTP